MATRVLRMVIASSVLIGCSLIFLNIANAEIVLHSNKKAERAFRAEVKSSSWSYAPHGNIKWMYLYCPRCFVRWRNAPLQHKQRNRALNFLYFGGGSNSFALSGGNYIGPIPYRWLYGPRKLSKQLFRENFYADAIRSNQNNCWPQKLHSSGSALPLQLRGDSSWSDAWPQKTFGCWP